MRGLVQAVSPAILERLVFSKPYFDRNGFILAMADERPVGFVHAGFGANENRSAISYERGTTCLLIVAAHESRAEIVAELLARSEQYLRNKGATEIYAGCAYPVNPFYLGLYGGSASPGILESDENTLELFRSAGYEDAQQRLVLHRKLAGFRPVVDRSQMQVRRRINITCSLDPATENWWQACTEGHTNRNQFTIDDRRSGECFGKATFWDMEPLASNWGVHAVGLMDIEIHEEQRRQGLGTFLLGESLRQLQAEGATLGEVQILEENGAARVLFKKLGFEEVDRGSVLRKLT